MTAPLRQHPYAEAHARTSRANADYRIGHPRTLKGMLRQAQREYALEPPYALHTGRLMDDAGDPAMTGQAQAYLGFHAPRQRPDDGEDDWRAVACRRDSDGFYVSPLRCAIESIRDPQRRAFVRDVVTDLFHAGDVAAEHGIPSWCSADVTFRSLELMFELYAPRPLPGPSRVPFTEKSESQVAAEDVVA